MDTNAKAVLVTAKSLIADPNKWLQAELRRDDGSCCSLGALTTATRRLTADGVFSDEVYMPARAALADAMYSGDSDSGEVSAYEVITRFNDAPERTHDEVMAAFDRAIAAVSSCP